MAEDIGFEPMFDVVHQIAECVFITFLYIYIITNFFIKINKLLKKLVNHFFVLV